VKAGHIVMLVERTGKGRGGHESDFVRATFAAGGGTREKKCKGSCCYQNRPTSETAALVSDRLRRKRRKKTGTFTTTGPSVHSTSDRQGGTRARHRMGQKKTEGNRRKGSIRRAAWARDKLKSLFGKKNRR